MPVQNWREVEVELSFIADVASRDKLYSSHFSIDSLLFGYLTAAVLIYLKHHSLFLQKHKLRNLKKLEDEYTCAEKPS